MRNRIQTYCQVNFLEKFFDQIPQITISEKILGNEIMPPFEEMSSLIYSNTNLSVDDQTKILDLAEKGNPFFKKLIKSSTTGGSIIIDCKELFINLLKNLQIASSTPFNSLHLYSDLHAVLLKSQLGFCIFTNDTWMNLLHYLSVKLIYKVDKNNDLNQFQGWNLLKEINLPINAAIIADNYILDKPENYKFNIFEIIKNLLPEKLEYLDFDLTIITKRDLVQPAVKFSKINDFIISLKKKYNVKLTIYCTPLDKPHDRLIITNYYFLQSGHSLDYFNNNGFILKGTTIIIVGLNADSNNIHTLLLEDFSRITSKGKLDFDMFGYGQNRLLSIEKN